MREIFFCLLLENLANIKKLETYADIFGAFLEKFRDFQMVHSAMLGNRPLARERHILSFQNDLS